MTKIQIERRRGFQPPWYRVAIYTCDAGHVTALRISWSGPTPPGGVRCSGCDQMLPFVG
jgi:hypothetical protein